MLQEQQIINSTAELQRFRTVAQLAQRVVACEREAEYERQRFALLDVKRYEAPEGSVIILSVGNKDNLRLEVPTYTADGDTTTLWERIDASHPDFKFTTESIPYDYIPHGFVYSFCGHSLEYDEETRNVWIYNDTRTVRAQFVFCADMSMYVESTEESRLD